MKVRLVREWIGELTEQFQSFHRVRCDSVPMGVLDVAQWTWLPR